MNCPRIVPFLLYILIRCAVDAESSGWAGEAGEVDASFALSGGPNATPSDVVVQPDGRILIAGPFTEYDGQTNHYVVRLESDGRLDTSFQVPVDFHHSDAAAHALALQPDGQVLVGGTMFLGSLCSGCGSVIRLNTDGSIDTSFKSLLLGWTVVELVLLPDGKTIAVGSIGSTGIIRLTASGASDPAFQPGTGADNGFVRAVALQEDGKIIVGGEFMSFNGVGPRAIARLEPDGALDPTFSPTSTSPYSAYVNAVTVMPNGNVVYGTDRGNLVCLSSAGTLLWAVPASPVWDLIPQTNGQVIVAGTGRGNDGDLMRLNGDGTVDAAFDSALRIEGVFNAMALARQTDGKIVAGGWSTDPANTILRFWGDPVTSAPRLTGFMEGAGFGIQIEAGNVARVIVEVSSTLGEWTPASTNLMTNGVAMFIDSDVRAGTRRFYRVQAMP